MRTMFSAVIAVVALVGCGTSNPRPQTATTVVVPDSFVRPAAKTTLAPVARGTIRLGEVDTASAPPTAVGGGPASQGTAQTSVGPMSPTTVTGADSPLDNATTAPPAGGQPGNATSTGSANAPAGPNSHGGTPAPNGR